MRISPVTNLIKKPHPFVKTTAGIVGAVAIGEKVKETVKHNQIANTIERTTIANSNERERYTKIKFSKTGVIDDMIVATSDFSNPNKVKTQIVNYDYRHNAVLKAEKEGIKFDTYFFDQYLNTDFTSLEKRIKNPITGKIEKLSLKKSQVDNVYNSTVTDSAGNTRIESVATKDSEGNILIKKDLVSLDGTRTLYQYQGSDDNNNIKMHYEIRDVDGNALSTVDRTFHRVSPELAFSSVNGHRYKIETKENAYIVTDELIGETTEIAKDSSLFWDKDAIRNHEIFQKLSGDVILDIYNRGYKYQYSQATGGCSDSYERRIYSSDDVFVFAHEQGHTKDFMGPMDAGYDENEANKSETKYQHKLVTNPMFRAAYEDERAAFVKMFSESEYTIAKYYVDKLEHYFGTIGGACETVANANGLLSTGLPVQSDNLACYYLQKYFPRTIAAASKLLLPHGNIYVGSENKN